MDEEPCVICSCCGAVIGEYVNGPEKGVWLRVGRVLLSSADGICECGKRWSWRASEKKLEDLITRITQHRFVFIDQTCSKVLTRPV